jgi:hypothetical protein
MGILAVLGFGESGFWVVLKEGCFLHIHFLWWGVGSVSVTPVSFDFRAIFIDFILYDINHNHSSRVNS